MTAKQLLVAMVAVLAVSAVAVAMPEEAGRGGIAERAAADGGEATAGAADKSEEKAATPGAEPATGYLDYKETGMPETPGLTTVAGRVVGSLALVIGLIFVAAVVLKRYLGTAKTPSTSRKVSELVEVTPLGGKRHLYLIRVADRLLVVGGGGDQLSLLSEIHDPAVLEQVATQPRRSDFFQLFHRVQGDVSPEAAAQVPSDPAIAG